MTDKVSGSLVEMFKMKDAEHLLYLRAAYLDEKYIHSLT